MAKTKTNHVGNGNVVINILIYAFITLVSLTCVLPYIHVIAKSLSSESFVIAKQVVLLPKGFTTEAYRKVFSDNSFIVSFGVTVTMTAMFTLVGMVITICAAYPLSRKTLRGRKFFTLLFIFTMYFQGGMIPDYILMNKLGLLETMSSLVLPLAFSAYNLVIMKKTLNTILGRIVLPLSKPILATLTLFYAVGRWNTYSDAMFYIKQNTSLRPLQLKLYYLIVAATESIQGSINDVAVSTVTDPEILKAACIVFATVPIILVYPFVQKYFVQGTMIGAVKG